MDRDTFNVLKFFGVIIVLLLLASSCTKDSASDRFYRENKKVIDDYNYRHKDDWDGYKGNRRNSMAETSALEHDGIDPDEYREQHGY